MKTQKLISKIGDTVSIEYGEVLDCGFVWLIAEALIEAFDYIDEQKIKNGKHRCQSTKKA